MIKSSPLSKFELVGVYNVVRSADTYSDNVETLTLAFTTGAYVEDVKQSLRLSEIYREYNDMLTVQMNYTPSTYNIAQSTDDFAFQLRGKTRRIVDAMENGRQSISFLTYVANTGVSV